MTARLRSPVALATLSELTKFRISLVSTLTTGTAHLACSHGFQPGLLPTLGGTLLLAMAAATLNEAQEYALDARMERTRLRPIPSGRVSLGAALRLVAALAFLGFGLLRTQGPAPAWLGLLAMAWYNGLYTPLKRISAFAVVPGSLVGALPPAMGWTAAGGNLGDPGNLVLCGFFFLWQVPHFWLLALLHQGAYAQAGLPTLARHFQEPQIFRLIFTWTCATLAAAGLLAGAGLVTGTGSGLLLLGGSLWLLGRFGPLLGTAPGSGRVRRAFRDINLFALVVMAAVALGSLEAP